MHGFNLSSDQPGETICACALALSAKNLLALSARNINPAHTPFTIFSIDQKNNKPYLKPISFNNNKNGLYFTKLTFIGDNEILGLQNTGKLFAIINNSSDQTITFKKILNQKKLWPDGIKDFAYSTIANQLLTLDTHNNLTVNTLNNNTIVTKKILQFDTLKNMIAIDKNQMSDIHQIKLSENDCGIFVSVTNQIPNTHYLILDTNQFNSSKKHENITLINSDQLW